MSKYFIIATFLTISIFGQLTAQTTIYTFQDPVSEITLNADYTWSPADGWTIDPQNGSGKLIVPKDKVLILYRTLYFAGVVEVYGRIEFHFASGEGGTLAMSPDSEIYLAQGEDRLVSYGSGGNGSNGNNHNFISIGDKSISGEDINLYGDGPNYFNYGSLESGGCGTAGCEFSTLPVNLLYFRSQNNAQGIQIAWASTEEWNFSHYTIERSDNGRDFTAIHEEYASQEESASLQTYQYLDRSPLHGANYYRLKTTDVDGTIEYKGMTLAYAGMTGNVRVSPNPARGSQITIHYPGTAAEGSWLSIMTSSGHEIMKVQMSESELRLPAASLSPGIYIITISNQLETKQQRLIVQ